ncbi:endonuclease/exonuclease/phosphatase family protein [Oleiharenicola lentus]|uniref:endonuclease/exonuclease/phosphatase family protein n=1 Tax=Oleiharenicola lentus TaxID=2508720 RepID=UPI003F66D9FD
MKAFTIFLSLCIATLAQALTVATYNVENYLIADRMADGVYRKAYPKPQTEKTALTQVISAIAPDVLAVEEMGTQPFLDEFQRELKQAGQNFPHTALVQAADADRHVALLSKIPFKEVKRHAEVGLTYFGQKDVVKRGVLEAIFATNEGDVSVFVIHLKSKRTERDDDPESTLHRQEEARAVRDLVFSRFPDPTKAKFIVTGDWNDTRSSKPVQALLKRGETKLGELLRSSDSHGEAWTHYFRREDVYSRIDYILVSPALFPFVEGKEAKIYDGESSTVGSDHRAVYAKFNLAPAK